MYTVTFFSFKGGVGRSMSLMNVALDLVSKGRKVVLIDFDLEAPGLNTFGVCNANQQGGIVDYIHSYLENQKAPDISDHIVPCNLLDQCKEKLWLIPAGTMDESYASKLASINWRTLYEEYHGFYLFEDLKIQIQNKFSPDYLLIDSRTGHTDIGGICTRQLPNAVVFLFFPNEQNLLGLKRVSDLVDHENGKRAEGNTIIKHFVTSNVPDLDDENRILATSLVKFSTQLGYQEKDLHIIHRYNSLSLLNQEIFTLSRPNTRLAEEYRKLTKSIIQENPEDREGAERFLTMLLKDKNANNLTPSFIKERIEKITEKNGNDASLLLLISQYKEQLGDYDDALRFIDLAIDQNFQEPSIYLRQARLNLISSNNKLAVTSALEKFFSLPTTNFTELNLALNLLSRTSPETLHKVATSKSFSTLTPEDFKAIIEMHFLNDTRKIELAEYTVKETLARNAANWTIEKRYRVMSLLPLIYISQGNFSDAVKLLKPQLKNEPDRAVLFNYAIAKWGQDKKPEKGLFNAFLEKVKNFDFSAENANYKQCLSLAYFLTGNKDAAINAAKIAQQQARDVGTITFSCWTYLYRTPKEFAFDVSEMLSMYLGEKNQPKIFTQSDQDLFK
jgi:MinD-like ATPase involved in chromosome partitioning or flagellar assembly